MRAFDVDDLRPPPTAARFRADRLDLPDDDRGEAAAERALRA